MHSFSELVDRCATFTLESLKDVNERTMTELETSGATTLIKTLQMITLQKAIVAVGMFSMFEAILQDDLKCKNGFAGAKEILKQTGSLDVLERFQDLELAINALKHGRGRSFDALVAKQWGTLPPTDKELDENPSYEGDLSDIATLVDVDETFIYHCAEVIRLVSNIITDVRPESCL